MLTYRCATDAEAAELIYDPTKITYRQILEYFYKMHDPTTLNSQGPDRGEQYRSGIYFHNAEQEKIAREVTKQVNEQWWGGKVVTEIVPAGQWWNAEEYHQKYLDRNPGGYACPSHFIRKFPELKYKRWNRWRCESNWAGGLDKTVRIMAYRRSSPGRGLLY